MIRSQLNYLEPSKDLCMAQLAAHYRVSVPPEAKKLNEANKTYYDLHTHQLMHADTTSQPKCEKKPIYYP